MDLGIQAFILGVPGALALVLFAVFTHLYRQSREQYFRVWQWGWGAHCVSYVLLIWFFVSFREPNAGAMAVLWLSKVAYAATIIAIYISTRLIKEDFKPRWSDYALTGVLLSWITLTVYYSVFQRTAIYVKGIPADPEIGFTLVLLYSAYKFFRISQERNSTAFRLITLALAGWAVLLGVRQMHLAFDEYFGGASHFLGPLPQTLLGIAMLTVLYENERRSVQDNLRVFADLEVDFSRVISADKLLPSLDRVLERLCSIARAPQALLYVLDPYREALPSAQRGMSPGFLNAAESEVGDAMKSLLQIRSNGTPGDMHYLPLSVLGSQADPKLVRLAEMLEKEGAGSVTVAAIDTRDHQLAVLLIPQHGSRQLGESQVATIKSLILQLATSLEKYALLLEAHRNTKEFELLTEIGQVVSSRLDQDEVLSAIHEELGKLMDVSTFYIAFQEEDVIRFEFEQDDGKLHPKRTRPISYGFTEHIIRTGQSLLIEENLEPVRDKLGVVKINRPAKCFCGAPIMLQGRVQGAIATLHYERENVYSKRDLKLIEIAARQVSVAVENARLFAQEQRRAKYLAFLNSISRMAISSQDANAMLVAIVREIQQTFNFEHIGVGMVNYDTKDIEIKAEAGSTAKALGKRIPLGVGIIGRVARTKQTALEQGISDHLLGIIPESRSVLCLPVCYGETLLGVLNVESQRERAFAEDEVLILKTLADLLATALHNVFVFQKMEHQSITDQLTGIKTRRYFNEALQSEFKRAMRTGRPFCVVLIDLDKFKGVNDGMGHLEGDLVLARIGRLLDQKVRQSNVVARYGGDEFVILMPETGVEQATVLSERLRLWIATDPFLNERQITGSFGVAEFPLHGATIEDIIREADTGMYISKRAGGNKVSTVEVAAQAVTESEHRQLVSTHLESVLKREQITSVDDILAAFEKISVAVGAEQSGSALREATRVVTRNVESREIHATGHGETVASYAEAIGRELELSEKELADLVFAAQVHDVGKILVPERLLNKAGTLTFEEYQLMQQHTEIGSNILTAIPDCEESRKMVLHHQERYDGAGYPDGLKGEQIPLGARIIAVAEAYVNMTADRPYAEGKVPMEAMMELERSSGTQFDGMLVRVLLKQLRGEKSVRA